MTKYPAPRFVQHQLAQTLITGKKPALVPKRRPRGWGNPADDDIAHFAFGMGGNHMNDGAGGAHQMSFMNRKPS